MTTRYSAAQRKRKTKLANHRPASFSRGGAHAANTSCAYRAIGVDRLRDPSHFEKAGYSADILVSAHVRSQ